MSAQRRKKQPPAEAERFELLDHLQTLLEPLMVALGVVFLVLLLIDFTDPGLSTGQRLWLDRATTTIWIAFLIDFGVRFFVAPSKTSFLRDNWLSAVSLALPFLRPLRALRALRGLRALRAVRSLSLVRLVGGVNRGMRLLRQVTRGRQVVYVAALTLFVVLAGAAGALFFDRGLAEAPIQNFGDALWWSAALVTTVNAEKYVVSPEARIVGVLMRLYAVSVFGLVTAAIASYFVGRDAEARGAVGGHGDPTPSTEIAGLRSEVASLRREGTALREELMATRQAIGQLTSGRDAAPNGAQLSVERAPAKDGPTVAETKVRRE